MVYIWNREHTAITAMQSVCNETEQARSNVHAKSNKQETT